MVSRLETVEQVLEVVGTESGALVLHLHADMTVQPGADGHQAVPGTELVRIAEQVVEDDFALVGIEEHRADGRVGDEGQSDIP